jgi:hypothetical protein
MARALRTRLICHVKGFIAAFSGMTVGCIALRWLTACLILEEGENTLDKILRITTDRPLLFPWRKSATSVAEIRHRRATNAHIPGSCDRVPRAWRVTGPCSQP